MYQPTTALRKIASLKKPTRVIQGGQGAGKTIGILIILINHALHNKDRKITIIQAELSKLKKTALMDFINIMKGYGLFQRHRWNKSESIYSFHNGSFIEFIGLDKADIGKGFRRDVIYFNELNRGGITLDAYMQFSSRASVTYSDFNPDKKFWLHSDILPDKDTDFIILTHNDNEYLPEKERNEIHKYLEKGFFDTSLEDIFTQHNIKSSYWANRHRVYGLGIPGTLEGVVFTNYEIIERVPPAAKYDGSAMDFGFSNDPTTLIDVYKYNGRYIYDEQLYRTGIMINEIARVCLSGDVNRVIYADPSEPLTIAEIARYGVRIMAASAPSEIRKINFGIALIQEEKFFVTKRSVNQIRELENYTWQVSRDGMLTDTPIDNFNHTIDPMRYHAIKKRKKNTGRYAVR